MFLYKGFCTNLFIPDINFINKLGFSNSTMAKKAAKTENKEEHVENKAENTAVKTEKISKSDKSDSKNQKGKEEKSKETSKQPKVITQPEVNIGLIGHVDHGKTTLTKALTGKWTDTHSEEIKRGITIRLGYANVTIRRCPKCDEPDCYSTSEKCMAHFDNTDIVRTVSFVDAPGHESLMATMLAGATIMDGALLLVAANEECPQPQTREHLQALEIMGIKNVIVVQNKIDLVTPEKAQKNYEQIREFLKNTKYSEVPIIPISAQHNVNIDLLIKTIEDIIPTPKRDEEKDPLMFIARSFDVNKPGTKPEKIIGGILGGTLAQGKLLLNEQIEIRPGRKVEREGKTTWHPITTKIVGLKTGEDTVSEVKPGGSIAVLTELDPTVVKSDSLVGNVVGHAGKLPPVWYKLTVEPVLLERVVGTKEGEKVEQIKLGEMLMLNVNAAATVGIVRELGKNKFHCDLKIPVCADKGARITISRRVGTRFRLIGYGIILGE